MSMDTDARNANMVRLAYFQQEMRTGAIDLATIVSAVPDLTDAQTVVDTIAASLDELTHQYHAALRKRDTLKAEAQS